jgi:hypothetical protein
MGYNEMDLVWSKSKATKADKLVLLAIARQYNKGRGSWPSQEWLADKCGMDERSVRRSINRLKALGELAWIVGSAKSGKSNTYFISFIERPDLSGETVTDLSANVTNLSAEKTDLSAISDQNVRPLSNTLNKLNKLSEKQNFESSFWPTEQDFRVVPFSPEMLGWARRHGMDDLYPLLRLEGLHERFELHPQNRGKVGQERARLFYAWFVNDFAEFRASRTNGGM